MINDYIGGGQVFLHKVRMLRQVIATTIIVSMLVGGGIAYKLNEGKVDSIDWDGALTYIKAQISITTYPAVSAISIGNIRPNVDAYSKGELWKKRMLSGSVITSHRFTSAYSFAKQFILYIAVRSLLFGLFAGVGIFILWSRFGKNLKDEKIEEGSNRILSSFEVSKILKNIGSASSFTIGKMPLVRDMETRHFLVTGSTGSGKTNLMHNLLPQIEDKAHPAIVLDQTGEMISKYYNPERGDVIFNPFDKRSHDWDFWEDCASQIDLESFAEILIGFHSKKGNNNIDFWESAAQSIFVGVAEYLKAKAQYSIEELYSVLTQTPDDQMQLILSGKDAAKHFTKSNAKTAASIMSVLLANIKPLRFLSDNSNNGQKFSLKQHFASIRNGSKAWLFLAAKPSHRNLTLPLLACLAELSMSRLMEIGINKDRRLWFIIDELPSLGKLPVLSQMLSEGRKYGACILAGMQSLNQLYSNYGHYDGSTIFGQFGTAFFFRNSEPSVAKMVSSMCGTETVVRQQKNTSFGANEFRDGVSYNEQQQKKQLIGIDDLANLAVGECYTILPEPKVRLSKIKVPEAKCKKVSQEFIEKQGNILSNKKIHSQDQKHSNCIEDILPNTNEKKSFADWDGLLASSEDADVNSGDTKDEKEFDDLDRSD